jgi:hypothetical protein
MKLGGSWAFLAVAKYHRYYVNPQLFTTTAFNLQFETHYQ